MLRDIDHASSLPGSHTLPRGPGVVLRPARLADLDDLLSLAAKAGIVCEELELARLVRSNPIRRLILCASGVVDDVETVLGIGVIELAASATQPSLLLVDTELTDGLGRVLADALVQQARELTDPRVA